MNELSMNDIAMSDIVMNDTVVLATVELTITQAAIRRYAELTDDFNPLHLDPEFAAGTPMKRPIAHGTLSLCLIWQCLQRNFGPDVFTDIELDVRFVKPVHVGEVLIAGGQWDVADPKRCEVWVRGQDGESRVVGTAIACQDLAMQEKKQ